MLYSCFGYLVQSKPRSMTALQAVCGVSELWLSARVVCILYTSHGARYISMCIIVFNNCYFTYLT